MSGFVSIALISGISMPLGAESLICGYFFWNALITSREQRASIPVSSGLGSSHTVRLMILGEGADPAAKECESVKMAEKRMADISLIICSNNAINQGGL